MPKNLEPISRLLNIGMLGSDAETKIELLGGNSIKRL